MVPGVITAYVHVIIVTVNNYVTDEYEPILPTIQRLYVPISVSDVVYIYKLEPPTIDMNEGAACPVEVYISNVIDVTHSVSDYVHAKLAIVFDTAVLIQQVESEIL